MKQVIPHLWSIASSIAIGCLATLSSVRAQIVPDKTLPINSIVAPGCTVCTIEGGTVQGVNLFHSFREFSVPRGGAAFFNNTSQIQNIFSRVTGQSVSNIDGLIRANGTANLFLLNPNGIIFGPNAQLNIGGSFLASTASSLKFADGSVFSATPAASTTPLLTISVPIGLQYGSNAGSIQVRGSSLQVNPGQTLALLGGDAIVDGGQLLAPRGRVELGGVAQGSVGLSVNGSDLRLSFPSDVARANVSLNNGAIVDVSDVRGGSIAVNAQNLNISAGSQLRSGISGVSPSNTKAGDIEINAPVAIALTGDGSRIANEVGQGAQGNAGNINITAGSLSVTNGAFLSASTFGRGNAGNVTINTGSLSVMNNSVLTTSANGVGNAGNLTINARDSASFENGSQAYANVTNKGNGGNITITAESFSLNNNSNVRANITTTGQGDAGNIILNTGLLSVTNNSLLAASTNGVGNAGNITINARDTALFDGGRAYTNVTNQGNGGNITITAESLSLKNGANVIASTRGQGDAGNVTIDTGSLSVMNGSTLAASANGVGNAGNITINARDTASFENGSQAYTNVTTKGNAGNITITAESFSLKNGSLLIASTTGEGDAGNVTIKTGSLIVMNDSILAASANGVGNAGNITINARDTASFDYGSQAYTDVTQKGKGGDINITAGSLSVTNGAQLVTNTQGQGDAGNIIINTGSLSLTNEAFLNSNSNTNKVGNAGNITINAQGPVSFIDRSSAFSNVTGAGTGKGGNITINAPSVNLVNGSFLATGVGDNNPDTKVQGDAGNISLQVGDTLSLNQSYIASRIFTNGTGKAGNIDIQAGSVSSDQSLISASTAGQGDAGGVTIQATGAIALANSDISTAVQQGATGNARGINIKARSLLLTDGAQLNAVTSGQGNAGDIVITTTDKVSVSGTNTTPAPANFQYKPPRYTSPPDFVNGVSSGIFSSTNSSGVGGNISVNTSAFSVANGALVDARTTASGPGGTIKVNTNTFEATAGGQLSAIASSSGTAGNINLNATEAATIKGSDPTYPTRQAQFGSELDIYGKLKVGNQGAASGLFANTIVNSTGKGGNIEVVTPNFNLTDRAQISAATAGGGSGGTLKVAASDITLSGNGTIAATAEATSRGQAGDVLLSAQRLTVAERAQVSTATNSPNPQASGGSLTVQATQLNLIGGSSLSAGTTGAAPGGNLTIQPYGEGRSLAVNFQGGSTASASTQGSGKGGTLTITAPESIALTGNGSVITAGTTGSGGGGDLILRTGSLNMRDGAQVTVSSTQSGTAGSLTVAADSIRLDNKAKINADTAGGGGNIYLLAPLVLLRHGSSITTNATGNNIPGGNITIDTNNLVAVPKENSDISANSADFRGGNITIFASGIFGTQFRPRPTPLSDITATGRDSSFNGTVQINLRDVEPTSRSNSLPITPIDPSRLLAQTCPPKEGNSFTITGRGGLPSNPTEVLSGDQVLDDLGSAIALNRRASAPVATAPTVAPKQIIEAQGWVVDSRGVVTLVAQAPGVRSHSNALVHPHCQREMR